MNFKTLSILSLSILMLQGCGSMSTRSGDGAVNVFKYMSFQEPGTAPWDPPIEVGYGGRIPNMQGDWDRHCSGKNSSVCRQSRLHYIKPGVHRLCCRTLSLLSTHYQHAINTRGHQSTASLHQYYVNSVCQERTSLREKRRSHEQINESTYKKMLKFL